MKTKIADPPSELISIALIEDMELMLQAFAQSLSQVQDFDLVGVAKTYREGYNLLTAYKPDVALIDIGLPDGNGIELVRCYQDFVKKQLEEEAPNLTLKAAKIKPSPPITTKIIFLTSSEEEETVIAAFALGAAGYFIKTGARGMDSLTEAIRAVHAGDAWIDPGVARIILDRVTAVQEPQLTACVSVEMEMQLPEKINHVKELLQNDPLTAREMDVLELLVEGRNNKAIASALFITVGTVKSHVRSILGKLQCCDRAQAAIYALRLGLLENNSVHSLSFNRCDEVIGNG